MTFLQIRSWRPGSYLRSSGELLVWLLLRALAQVSAIVLLTHYLGADGYGLFVATLAISSFFTPMAGLGLQAILLRDGARNSAELPRLLGATFTLWWPSTLVFSLTALPAAIWFSASSLSVILLAAFIFSEITSNSLVELASRVEQSQHRTRAFGALQAGLPLSRAIGLFLCTSLAHPDPRVWMSTYAASGLIYASSVALWIKIRYNPIIPEKRDWSIVCHGLPFTIGALSFRLQGEINKPLLAQIGYTETGYFSIAQRVVEFSSLPLIAMQEALWPNYYANNESQKKALVTGLFLVVLALLGGFLLTLAAPLLPYLLGAELKESANIVIYLAWLPALQVVRNLMNATLFSKNQKALLTWIYLISSLISITLNAILITHIKTLGAILSLYITEITLTLLMLITIFKSKK